MFIRTHLFKKAIPLLIAISMISFIVIAFDNHVTEVSATCPICQAKISINGVQSPITIESNPIKTYHYQVEQSPNVIIPIALFFENRAPPEVHQS